MTDNIESRIINEINKSGFPLELRVTELLRSRGYSTDQSVYFVDNDEGKGREFDIYSRKISFQKKKKQNWFAENIFTIECKKSDKPWVIFTSPKDGDDDNIFDYDMMAEVNLEIPVWSVETIWQTVIEPINEVSPLFDHPRHGRTYFIPFTNSEAGDAIYKALTTSVKAAVAIKDKGRFGGHCLSFYYPTIVLQGRLFESYLENGNSQLSEVEILPVRFTYQSAQYNPIRYIVPIVTEKALKKYLESLEKVLDIWVELVKENVKMIKPENGV